MRDERVVPDIRSAGWQPHARGQHRVQVPTAAAVRRGPEHVWAAAGRSGLLPRWWRGMAQRPEAIVLRRGHARAGYERRRLAAHEPAWLRDSADRFRKAVRSSGKRVDLGFLAHPWVLRLRLIGRLADWQIGRLADWEITKSQSAT